MISGVHLRRWREGNTAALLDHSCWLALWLKSGRKLQHSLCGVVTPVEQDILNITQELLVNLVIGISLHLRSIHNTHVHTSIAGMVQESAVEAPPHSLISSERKGNVGDASTDLAVWTNPLDLSRGTNEVNSIVVVLSKSRTNSQDVWIENDIVARESNLLNKNAVSSLANAHLVLKCCGLTLLIKGHHNNRSAVVQADSGVVLEGLLALLQRN